MLNQHAYREAAINIYKKNEPSLSEETKKALKPLFQRFINV
jgi:hypothetical protein